MHREAAISRIKTCEASLRALGVESISLFGSVARGDEHDDSDVDVVVVLPHSKRGFAVVGLIENIRKLLTKHLGVPVDVVPEPRLGGRIKMAIERDRLRVFQPSNPKRRFSEIVENANAIAKYTDGMTEAEFRANQLVIDATERCLMRISEASIKLGAIAEKLAPEMPWRDIRGIGNWLRHGYDEIALDTIWDIVGSQLVPLKEAAIRAMTALDARPPNPSLPKRSRKTKPESKTRRRT